MSKLLKALLFGMFFKMNILEGDGGSDGESAVGTGNDARIAMLARINDANDREHADDMAEVNDDGTTSAFVVRDADGNETALDDETVADPEAAATIDALAAETGDPMDAPRMFRIKVNGREMDVTEAQLIERAQKVESADQYLAEASRLRAEQVSKTQTPQVDSERESVVNDDLAIARAIQMGTEEEAVAALQKLRKASPSVTTDDIARTIDERLTFNEAIQNYRKDYADIVGDPVLNQLALDTDRKLLAAGDKRSYAERYSDIGNTLRAWAIKLAKDRAPAPGAEKLARKAAIAAPPKAASQKTASSVEDEVDESTSSVIANIAKSRGGPQWMNGASTQH